VSFKIGNWDTDWLGESELISHACKVDHLVSSVCCDGMAGNDNNFILRDNVVLFGYQWVMT
jgi:hypothetical protein